MATSAPEKAPEETTAQSQVQEQAAAEVGGAISSERQDVDKERRSSANNPDDSLDDGPRERLHPTDDHRYGRMLPKVNNLVDNYHDRIVADARSGSLFAPGPQLRDTAGVYSDNAVRAAEQAGFYYHGPAEVIRQAQPSAQEGGVRTLDLAQSDYAVQFGEIPVTFIPALKNISADEMYQFAKKHIDTMNTQFGTNLSLGSEKNFKKVFPLLMKECEKQNMNPLLVASLIAQESSFNPNAVGQGVFGPGHPLAGQQMAEIGLMQILPETGAGIKYIDKSELERIRQATRTGSNVEQTVREAGGAAKENIAAGIGYLKNRLEAANGNLLFAIAGYNQGSPSYPRSAGTKAHSTNVRLYYAAMAEALSEMTGTPEVLLANARLGEEFGFFDSTGAGTSHRFVDLSNSSYRLAKHATPFHFAELDRRQYDQNNGWASPDRFIAPYSGKHMGREETVAAQDQLEWHAHHREEEMQILHHFLERTSVRPPAGIRGNLELEKHWGVELLKTLYAVEERAQDILQENAHLSRQEAYRQAQAGGLPFQPFFEVSGIGKVTLDDYLEALGLPRSQEGVFIKTEASEVPSDLSEVQAIYREQFRQAEPHLTEQELEEKVQAMTNHIEDAGVSLTNVRAIDYRALEHALRQARPTFDALAAEHQNAKLQVGHDLLKNSDPLYLQNAADIVDEYDSVSLREIAAHTRHDLYSEITGDTTDLPVGTDNVPHATVRPRTIVQERGAMLIQQGGDLSRAAEQYRKIESAIYEDFALAVVNDPNVNQRRVSLESLDAILAAAYRMETTETPLESERLALQRNLLNTVEKELRLRGRNEETSAYLIVQAARETAKKMHKAFSLFEGRVEEVSDTFIDEHHLNAAGDDFKRSTPRSERAFAHDNFKDDRPYGEHIYVGEASSVAKEAVEQTMAQLRASSHLARFIPERFQYSVDQMVENTREKSGFSS